MSLFNDKVAKLLAGHEALLMRKNEPVEEGNGVITRPWIVRTVYLGK